MAMSTKPVVSIVLPTFNGSMYLRDSIDSILDQSFRDWELIIVDDCSSDDTLTIANNYAAQDSRISVVHNSYNMKLPATLNRGFERAKGRYFTWTSDDNMYMPHSLQEMVTYLEENKDVFFVRADMDFIDEDGKIQGKLSPFNENDIWLNNNIGACFLYRSQVYYEIGGYDTGLFGVEDYDYWIRIYIQYGKLANIAKSLYKYRFHSHSLTNTIKPQVLYTRFLLREKYFDHILQNVKNNELAILHAYFDAIRQGTQGQALVSKILKVYPILRYEQKFNSNGMYALFGAGEIGIKTQKLLQERAVFFIDNDTTKQNTTISGIPVYSFEVGVKKIGTDCTIMTTTSAKYLPAILQQITDNGITNYCISQNMQ